MNLLALLALGLRGSLRPRAAPIVKNIALKGMKGLIPFFDKKYGA